MINMARIMQIPSSIQDYLEKMKIQWQSVPASSIPIWAVPVLYVADAKAILVITASNKMIDISKLQQVIGDAIRPAPQKAIDKFLAKHALQTLPVFQEIIGVKMYVDEALKNTATLVIKTDTEDFIQCGSGDIFTKMDNVEIANFSLPIKQLHNDYALTLFDIDVDHIEEAVQKFTVLRIRQRLEETLEMPPMPETARAIIRLRADPDADGHKLAKIVENDPSLAAQVVSWASASYYAAPGYVKSVQDAIVRVLGFDLVMNLALGLSLGKSLDLPKNGPRGVTPFWNEAVYVGSMMAGLVKLIPQEYRPTYGLAYLSGLLHNFGYLVLANSFRPHFENIARLIEINPHLEPSVAEEKLIGINREQIAANLMKSWGLPDEVCYGIRYQTQPEYSGIHKDYSQLLFVGVQLLRREKIITGPVENINDSLWTDLQLDKDAAFELVETLKASMQDLNSLAENMNH
jgi:HD-like signal output (HDOD) protein